MQGEKTNLLVSFGCSDGWRDLQVCLFFVCKVSMSVKVVRYMSQVARSMNQVAKTTNEVGNYVSQVTRTINEVGNYVNEVAKM